MSLYSRLRRKRENSCHVGVQQDGSFYSDLHEVSDILIMLLICVESGKIPLLQKFKQLFKCLPVGFSIDVAYILLITYCTSCTPGWRFISSIRNRDHVMKTLYMTHVEVFATRIENIELSNQSPFGGPIKVTSKLPKSTIKNVWLQFGF